jgi:hypothetical protein
MSLLPGIVGMKNGHILKYETNPRRQSGIRPTSPRLIGEYAKPGKTLARKGAKLAKRKEIKTYIFGFGAGSSLAGHTDSKPAVRWDPSQNGLFWECPQRHNPIVVRPAKSNGFPSAS